MHGPTMGSVPSCFLPLLFSVSSAVSQFIFTTPHHGGESASEPVDLRAGQRSPCGGHLSCWHARMKRTVARFRWNDLFFADRARAAGLPLTCPCALAARKMSPRNGFQNIGYISFANHVMRPYMRSFGALRRTINSIDPLSPSPVSSTDAPAPR